MAMTILELERRRSLAFAALLANPALTGIAMMAASVTLFAIVNVGVKALAADYSVVQIVFFRQLLSLPVLGFALWRAGGLPLLRSRNLGVHGLRGLLGVAGTCAFFVGLARLPLADAVAIGFVTPILVTALAPAILGERVGWRRWSAVLAGFLGVLLILRPGLGMFGTVGLVVVAGCALIAVHVLLGRKLGRTERSVTIALHFTVASTLIAGVALPFAWTPIAAADWPLFLGLGLLGGIGMLLLTQAYRIAQAAVVAPFDYLHILWATLAGFLLWGEVPTWHVVVGSAVVIASGLYIAHREFARRRAS